MESYFYLLYNKYKLIKNNKKLISTLKDYLYGDNDNLKENLYNTFSENAYIMQKKISLYFDTENNKFFYGIINNNDKSIIWDSSAYKNIYNEHIELANFVNYKDSIEKFNLNNGLKKNYIKNYSKTSCNPSIIIPLKIDNYTILIYVHAWININNFEFICDSDKNDECKKTNCEEDIIDFYNENIEVNCEENDYEKEDIIDFYNENIEKNINIEGNINIELENTRNETREAIRNNEPIEEKLNVIIVMSNPCKFKRRVQLAKEFIVRMMYEKNVELYVVELAYDCNPNFNITEENNKKHLRLRCKTPLWHKENMINIGVRKLLPNNWKAFAWIDADVEFESETWAVDTLKILNGYKDVVQIFSHFIHMKKNKTAMGLNNSFGYKFNKNDPYCYDGSTPNFWHPGFAWACTRKAYEQMNGLYEINIIGGGDYATALSLKDRLNSELVERIGYFYKDYIIAYSNRCAGLRLGYIPGVIRHYYHGSIKNRNYKNRYKILEKYNYNHSKDITYNKDGLMVPTNNFSENFKRDIYNYFAERNEDED